MLLGFLVLAQGMKVVIRWRCSVIRLKIKVIDTNAVWAVFKTGALWRNNKIKTNHKMNTVKIENTCFFVLYCFPFLYTISLRSFWISVICVPCLFWSWVIFDLFSFLWRHTFIPCGWWTRSHKQKRKIAIKVRIKNIPILSAMSNRSAPWNSNLKVADSNSSVAGQYSQLGASSLFIRACTPSIIENTTKKDSEARGRLRDICLWFTIYVSFHRTLIHTSCPL